MEAAMEAADGAAVSVGGVPVPPRGNKKDEREQQELVGYSLSSEP